MKKLLLLSALFLFASSSLYSQSIDETLTYINSKYKKYGVMDDGPYFKINKHTLAISGKKNWKYFTLYDLRKVNFEIKKSDPRETEKYYVVYKCADRSDCIYQETLIVEDGGIVDKTRYINKWMFALKYQDEAIKVLRALNHLKGFFPSKVEKDLFEN
jgi:hypothetical protein